jgi:hypothetical protein
LEQRHRSRLRSLPGVLGGNLTGQDRRRRERHRQDEREQGDELDGRLAGLGCCADTAHDCGSKRAPAFA